MIFYIVILFVVTGTAYLLRRKKNILYKVSFFELAVIIGLRSPSVGNDSDAYLSIFEMVKNTSVIAMTKYGIEPGYDLLNKIVIWCRLGFQWILIISAIVSMYFVVDYIKQHSESVHYSLWLYITFTLFQTNFTRIRQGIAIGFVLKGYDLLSKKKTYKAIIFFVIAIAFHYTSIVAIVMLFFYDKKFDKKYILILFGWLLFAFFGAKYILEILVGIISVTKYAHYADMGGDGEMILLLYFAISVMIFVCKYNVRHNENTSEIDRLCFFSFFMVVTQSLSLSILIFSRAGEYFAVPMFLMLPNIFKYYEAFSRKIMIIGIWFFSLILYIYMLTKTLMPYSFFWQ